MLEIKVIFHVLFYYIQSCSSSRFPVFGVEAGCFSSSSIHGHFSPVHFFLYLSLNGPSISVVVFLFSDVLCFIALGLIA